MQKACFDFEILMVINIGDHHAKTFTKSHESLGLNHLSLRANKPIVKCQGDTMLAHVCTSSKM